MLNYTAIDFETANSFRGSPCQVGLVRVRNGHPVEEHDELLRPPERADAFHPLNVSIHGIKPEHVADKRRWREALPDLLEFIGNDILIAHTASFDIQVIQSACKADGIPWPQLRYACSERLARGTIILGSYKLPDVLKALGAPRIDHHDALADAHGVVHIVSGLARKTNTIDLPDLMGAAHVELEYLPPGQEDPPKAELVRPSAKTKFFTPRPRPPEPNPHADPNGPLYGRAVVVTGEPEMGKERAYAYIATAGGKVRAQVSGKTDLVVVGHYDGGVSNNLREAYRLRDAGRTIQIITDREFVLLLGRPGN